MGDSMDDAIDGGMDDTTDDITGNIVAGGVGNTMADGVGNTMDDTTNDAMDGGTDDSVDDAMTIDKIAKQTSIFITFEGGEGVGKSTQIRLLAARLEASGYKTRVLRDPGGTVIGEKIRGILLDTKNAELDSISELLLYEAARAQLVAEHILPALEDGMIVLCDRFTDSTLTYQGVARGLGFDVVKAANKIGSKELVPDRTIVLTRDVEVALKRASKNGADRLESEGIDFHTRVHEAFAALALDEPERVRVVKNQSTKAATAEFVFGELRDLFPRAADTPFEITPELLQQIKKEKQGE